MDSEVGQGSDNPPVARTGSDNPQAGRHGTRAIGKGQTTLGQTPRTRPGKGQTTHQLLGQGQITRELPGRRNDLQCKGQTTLGRTRPGQGQTTLGRAARLRTNGSSVSELPQTPVQALNGHLFDGERGVEVPIRHQASRSSSSQAPARTSEARAGCPSNLDEFVNGSEGDLDVNAARDPKWRKLIHKASRRPISLCRTANKAKRRSEGCRPPVVEIAPVSFVMNKGEF